MNYFDFNPFGNESLLVQFKCDVCGNKVESEEIEIPTPNYQSESASDSQTEEDGVGFCEQCGKQFNISIYSTFAGGDGNIFELPENSEITVKVKAEPYYQDDPYYEEQYEAISSNTLFFKTFSEEIDNLRELNQTKLDNPLIDKILKRQIFIGVIGCLETYLSDAFINTTLNSKEFTKRFVATFKDFKKTTVPLNELFEHYDRIETTCKQSMLTVIYHNLPKVEGMYKDTLDVDLGNIEQAQKAVLVRHDLVHRNGKTKKGEEVLVDESINEELLSNIEKFVTSVDAQLETKGKKPQPVGTDDTEPF